MSKLFQVPKKPVDGYEIKLWRIEHTHSITLWRAVYHVNSPWLAVEPVSDIEGSPFIDQWAVFYNGRLQGRNEGWGAFEKNWNEERSFPNFFKTEEEAKAGVSLRLRALIAKLNEDVIELGRRLNEVETPTPLDVAVRQLFADMAKNYQDYDIIAGWGLAKGSPEGNTAETALDIVVKDLLEKAITA